MDSNYFYSMQVSDGTGNVIDFNQLRNKVVLIVNVASLCGFAPQYHELQQLYEKYARKGLRILAFPCNQFAGQEPQKDRQIVEYVRKTYRVTFPIMKKIVVNGPAESPVYTFLKSHQRNEFGFKGVKWNFEKFLVDGQGNVIHRFSCSVTPLQFEAVIQDMLNRLEEQKIAA